MPMSIIQRKKKRKSPSKKGRKKLKKTARKPRPLPIAPAMPPSA